MAKSSNEKTPEKYVKDLTVLDSDAVECWLDFLTVFRSKWEPENMGGMERSGKFTEYLMPETREYFEKLVTPVWRNFNFHGKKVGRENEMPKDGEILVQTLFYILNRKALRLGRDGIDNVNGSKVTIWNPIDHSIRFYYEKVRRGWLILQRQGVKLDWSAGLILASVQRGFLIKVRDDVVKVYWAAVEKKKTAEKEGKVQSFDKEMLGGGSAHDYVAGEDGREYAREDIILDEEFDTLREKHIDRAASLIMAQFENDCRKDGCLDRMVLTLFQLIGLSPMTKDMRDVIEWYWLEDAVAGDPYDWRKQNNRMMTGVLQSEFECLGVVSNTEMKNLFCVEVLRQVKEEGFSKFFSEKRYAPLYDKVSYQLHENE